MSMSYTALVQSFTPQRNPLCRPFEVDRVLHRCFRSDILPDRADYPRFHDADIFGGLYLTTRVWKDRIEPPHTQHPHESLLDLLFWDDTFPRKPLCILGMVGAGKSTLIDYYLRCYCPTRGSRQADFDKKLVLHFDARTIRDNTDFYHRFFLFLQSEMRARCLERGFDLDEAVRRRPTQPQNVRQWVHAALEELTRVPPKSPAPSFAAPSPFPYIVLVVDNLDQSSIDVQIRAITEVEQWLRTPSIRLSRVILPMWPSTFRKLQNHQFNLLHGARVFEIGPIDTAELMANRERATGEYLQRQSFQGSEKVVEYIAQMTWLGRERLLPRIKAMAHENLRLTLALWESFLCGEAAYHIWKQVRQNPESRRSFEYEMLDALLVGTNDALDHNEHRIANLFAMGAGRVRPRDLLIGHHALQLLGQNRRSQIDLHQALRSLGYAETNIGVVEKSLLTFNFLHEEPAGGKKIEYEIHDDVVQEYLALRFEPTYVDNVAMVTPVGPKYLPLLSKTRGDRAEDFPRRVATTLAFIGFIRECEDSFCDPTLVVNTPGEVFIKALELLKLVRLWKPMALRYHDRLAGLRGSGYLRGIEPGWWDATLGNPLFEEARAAGEFLIPPHR
jgi:hypothetical protein